MPVHRTFVAAAIAACLLTGVAQAQTPDREDRTTTGGQAERVDRADEDDFDLGWLGLIGLLGLAGLAGRRREIDREARVRTDRV